MDGNAEQHRDGLTAMSDYNASVPSESHGVIREDRCCLMTHLIKVGCAGKYFPSYINNIFIDCMNAQACNTPPESRI